MGLDDAGAKQGVDDDHVIQVLLRACLTGVIPPDATFRAMPLLVRWLCEDPAPLSAKTLQEAILDPATPLDVIMEMKEHAKDLVSSASTHAERAVATTLYYATIASAILFHGTRITQYSPGTLAISFDALIGQGWMLPELSAHFEKARAICNKSTK